jgi:chitinase
MNPTRFDGFVRSLTGARSRRGALQLLLGAVLGALGLANLRSSDAQPRHKGVRRAPTGQMLLGYYVGYERDLLPPDEIDWSALTHLVVGPVLPQQTGTLDLGFDLDDPSQGPDFARDLAQRAHDHGVVPLLMIGGAGAHDGFKAAASSKKRQQFVRNLVATLHDLGFDGLDLDWEPLQAADQKSFQALVAALRSALPEAILTAPAEPPTLNGPAVPAVWATVAPQLDQINLMTYNMEGAYPGWKSWHSSALDGATEATPSSVAVAVAAFRDAGVPASKLGVGVGFFGDCWRAPVTGPSQDLQGADIVATDNEMPYTTILADYFAPAAAHVDPTAQAPYLSFPTPKGAKGCTYITYEDAASIAAKGQWARSQGLAGAIIWTINQGHDRRALPGQRDALLQATRQAFGL